jgi:DNA-binding MarR family transcriptional regulator
MTVAAEESASGTRWLDADELAAWTPFCGLLLTLPGALDGQLQRDADLTLFGYLVLARLSEAPRRTLRMSDLAQMANGSLSRLSHAVARLERHGWVVRATCPSDGRFTIATLTEAGHEKLVGAAPGHVAAVRRLVLDAIGAEGLAELGRIAVTIVEGPVGPSAPGCPG